MHCPLCLDTVLDITYHAGIEVDICPRCRGVWLDRGELDRLSVDSRASNPRREHSDQSTTRDAETGRDTYRDDQHRHERSGKKRKKRLSERLGDVFEEIIDL